MKNIRKQALVGAHLEIDAHVLKEESCRLPRTSFQDSAEGHTS